MFVQMAKEDTINLRAEIRSEMNKHLVTLREEGLPLNEIETKMLSMTEELMKKMIPWVNDPFKDDLPTMETNPMINDEMERRIDYEKVSEEESVEFDTPVLQEVSTLELNTQQWEEIESEDDDHIEIVWEEEKPTQGNILNFSYTSILENTFTPTLIENTYDICEDDSFMIYNDNLDECDKASFCSWECDSLNFCDNDLGSEDNRSYYSCESEFSECDNSRDGESSVDTLDGLYGGAFVHWDVFNDKFLGDRIDRKEREIGQAILKRFGVVCHDYLAIGFVFPSLVYEFKDIPHLRAYLEAKVHGTLGKVPKSVCFKG